MFGAWLGAVISKCQTTVKKYLGFMLIPQAGVAIGLSLLAIKIVPQYGDTIRAVVLCATLIYELIGPVATKLALRKAGEIPAEGQRRGGCGFAAECTGGNGNAGGFVRRGGAGRSCKKRKRSRTARQRQTMRTEILKCPVCGGGLMHSADGKKPICINRHCFDIARKGYVNLLMRAGGRHGDDKTMLEARRDFYQGALSAHCGGGGRGLPRQPTA